MTPGLATGESENRNDVEVSAIVAPRRTAQPAEVETLTFPSDRQVRELLDRWWSYGHGSRAKRSGGDGAGGADLLNSVNLGLGCAVRAARACHPGPWSGRPKTRPTPHQLTCRICNGRRGPDGETLRPPLSWAGGCPVEAFYLARGRANRAVRAAASYQFDHVPAGWEPRQNPRRDTPEQARARRLWALADVRCEECDEAEHDPAFDLVVRFLGIVLAACSVIEDPATFGRYAIP